jgi:hypothetical protein
MDRRGGWSIDPNFLDTTLSFGLNLVQSILTIRSSIYYTLNGVVEGL